MLAFNRQATFVLLWQCTCMQHCKQLAQLLWYQTSLAFMVILLLSCFPADLLICFIS